MLSHPPVQPQRHRRQNSTPSGFAVKIAPQPQPAPRPMSHRRGLSLDTRRPLGRPDYVSTTTNPGPAPSQLQQVLREAQQQRIARPGPGQPAFGLAEDYMIAQRYDMALGFEYEPFFDSALSTPTFMIAESPDWVSEGETPRRPRRISNGIMEKVARYEALERPMTPTSQNATTYPPTPVETPMKQERNRFADDYDESMEETIKPARNARSSAIFQEMRQQAELAFPMNTVSEFKMEQLDGPDMSRPYETPDPRSLHRRTDSLASIASAASIANLNIEETKTETGVTMDDIAIYIEGPDAKDGKWVCVFEGCNKRFGRKENIKSHVQTHLNDRQYQCPTCQKCFVRQHDLKRHAKIHTGIKPYPCECGNSFARHDALTRHRQRGMCVGAFDGVVRKVVKRGRPRKHRPELDERRDKSERTRRKNQGSSCSSACSQSGYSDSSAATSPADLMMDDWPLEVDMMPLPMSSATMSSAPMPSAMAPMPSASPVSSAEATVVSPMSPSYSQISRESIGGDPIAVTSPASNYSQISRASIGGDPLASPAKSHISDTHVPGTPPGLSASSSPPQTNVSTRYFDLDPNTSGLSDLSIGLGTTAAVNAACALPGLMDEMLLEFAQDGLVPLDREAFLMGPKFEDDFDAVNLFTNGDDMFFGTS